MNTTEQAREEQAQEEAKVRKAKEALDYAQNAENEARRVLSHATAITVCLRRKYENALLGAEHKAVALIKAGLLDIRRD